MHLIVKNFSQEQLGGNSEIAGYIFCCNNLLSLLIHNQMIMDLAFRMLDLIYFFAKTQQNILLKCVLTKNFSAKFSCCSKFIRVPRLNVLLNVYFEAYYEQHKLLF